MRYKIVYHSLFVVLTENVNTRAYFSCQDWTWTKWWGPKNVVMYTLLISGAQTTIPILYCIITKLAIQGMINRLMENAAKCGQ